MFTVLCLLHQIKNDLVSLHSLTTLVGATLNDMECHMPKDFSFNAIYLLALPLSEVAHITALSSGP